MTAHKKKNLHGLRDRTFPVSVAWRVGIDYEHLLSDDEKQWLSDFNDRFHGGDFRSDEEGEWDTASRRAAYVNKNVANSDVYSALSAFDLFEPIEEQFELESPPWDVSPTPEYLSSEGYKEELAAFRATLAPGRKPVSPAETPEHEAAKKALRRYHLGQTVYEDRTGRDDVDF